MRGAVGSRKLERDDTNHVFNVDERVVDGDDLNLRLLEGSTEDETADTTETVDSNLDSHVCEVSGMNVIYVKMSVVGC